MMKKNEKRCLLLGSVFLAMFVLWTALIQMVDVQSVGQNETSIGFATFNCWFHHLIGVNKVIYTITDWMGLVPIVVCLVFAGVGLIQLIKRRSIFKVDADIMKDRKEISMGNWRNVTNTFSEERRHYSNTYLEICEVYDEAVEVSVFSAVVTKGL